MRSLRYVYAVILAALLSCNKDNVDPLTQFNADVAAIDNYLLTNGISASKDIRGIRFTINSTGYGLPPRSDQTVRVKFTGRLLSTGTTFDQGIVQGVLKNYITGWQIGVSLLPKGAKAILYIPSDYGYGGTGNTALGIPAKANLIYDIELLDVIVSATEANQLVSDIAKVDKYLTDNSITAVQDTTGVRYVINVVGNGAFPSWYDKVKFSYSGRLMTSGVQFATGLAVPNAEFDSRVVDYLAGFQVGLQKMRVGSKATLYLPSGLAFGTSSNADIPANANLIYEIELQELVP